LLGKIAIISAIFFALGFGATSQAKELVDSPVYDPVSKSYFEMVDGLKIYHGYQAHEGPNWTQANDFARARVFGGARGRLAVIKSVATHDFLKQTFQPQTYVWIGLRYMCANHQLLWANGETFARGDFGAWDQRWNQDVYGCNGPGEDWMPIAYSPLPVFHWVGKGIDKRYYYFFVEYPTGHPVN
jgi:hypothetical protein